MKKEEKINLLILFVIFLSIVIFSLNLELIIASTPGPIDNCQILDTSGEYTLSANIINDTITNDCINITSQNITLDCQGYSITSTQNFTGVYSNQRNTTIKNCNISMGTGNNVESIGIEMTDIADYSSIINNTIIGNMMRGIDLASNNNGPENSLVENNTVDVSRGSGGRGIYLYSASNNTLISNTGRSNSSYGIYLYLSSNNTLISNTGRSNSSLGIYLESSSKNNLISNTGTSNSSLGIYLYLSSNNTLISNTGRSNSNVGIYLDTNSNNTLINNTGTSNSNVGIYLQASSNNTLISNTGTSDLGIDNYGIYLYLSSNNTLISNTGTSNSNVGIYLNGASDNSLTLNTGTSNSSYGIRLSSSSNNTLTSNTGTSNSNVGIYLQVSSNNTLTSNTGTSNSSYGTYLYSSNNNILETHSSEGYLNNSYGIAFRNVNNTIIKNCINVSGVKGDILYVTDASSNNTFINCSYRTTGTNETVIAGGSLIRKWYYRAYVNDTDGNNVSAQINATNVSGGLEFSINSDSTGWTNITTITEYVNYGGTRSYYNNYSMFATNGSASDSHNYNVTYVGGNKLNDVFTLSDAPPIVYLLSPANNTLSNSLTKYFAANATDNFNITNITLYVWNSSGSVINQTTNVTGIASAISNISITLPYDDNYTWNYYACDNTGNCVWNDTNFTLRIDSTAPVINITYPVNGTINSYNVSNLNYTYYDLTPGYCWYSNNSGVWNSSVQSAGTNFTGLISNHGSNTWILFCNDSSGNLNFTSVSFIKNKAPNITKIDIVSPVYAGTHPKAIMYYYDLDSDSATLTFQWLINGINVENDTQTNVPSQTLVNEYLNYTINVGDVINIAIYSNDGYNITSNYWKDIIWKYDNNKISTSDVYYVDCDDDFCYAIDSEGYFLKINKISGVHIYNRTAGYENNITISGVDIAGLSCDDDFCYAGDYQGYFLKLNKTSGKHIYNRTAGYENKVCDNYFLGFYCDDNFCYGTCDDDGYFVKINKTSGNHIYNMSSGYTNLWGNGSVPVYPLYCDDNYCYAADEKGYFLKINKISGVHIYNRTAGYEKKWGMSINSNLQDISCNDDFCYGLDYTNYFLKLNKTSGENIFNVSFNNVSLWNAYGGGTVSATSGMYCDENFCYIAGPSPASMSYGSFFKINKTSGKQIYNMTAAYSKDINDPNDFYTLDCDSSYCYLIDNSSYLIKVLKNDNVTVTTDPDTPIITFSCTPVSVTVGGTITCTCSATDDYDSSPEINYTVNPSTSTAGTFATTCTAEDASGNTNSSNISYAVTSSGNSPSGGSPGGGGGGGGGGTVGITHVVDSLQLTKGYNNEITTKDKIKFLIEKDYHYVTVNSISSNSAIIIINSKPQTIIFNVSEEKKIDLTDDDIYDISIKLNNVNVGSNRVNLTIKTTNEKIIINNFTINNSIINEYNQTKIQEENISQTSNNTNSIKKNKISFWIYIIIIIILIIIILIIGVILTIMFIKKKDNIDSSGKIYNPESPLKLNPESIQTSQK